MTFSRSWRLFALTLLLAGCGDGPAATVTPPPTTATVNVGNIFFQSARNGSENPAVDTVAVGGTVTWQWIETGTHGLSFADPDLPESPELTQSGSVFSVAFSTAGTYSYICFIHGSIMSGSVVVK